MSLLGACRNMVFSLISSLSSKINARNMTYMAVRDFQKTPQSEKNAYNPIRSEEKQEKFFQMLNCR